ncbi:MAG: DNA polymerase/3'-5' exonuclease PolX [Chloroflexota bacterium]
MPASNTDIAAIFGEMADLLALEGANTFRVRAYRNAAAAVETYPRPVADLLAEGQDLADLESIGEELARKIEEIVRTGRLKQLEALRARTPAGVTQMLKVPGLGPKRVQKIYAALKVEGLAELKQAAQAGKIRALEGFGPRMEAKILEGLARLDGTQGRILLHAADEIAKRLLALLETLPGVAHVAVAGSYRRCEETVGDLDILVSGENGKEILARFAEFEDVRDVVSQGETRATFLLRRGLQVDLRVIAEESYGAALLYFTGSKAHNIHLRRLATERGLKINEYGVFRQDARLAGRTEAEVYGEFGMPFIEPELRQDRGEIEAALGHRLPSLVTQKDLRGDLQMHTQASDGRASLEAMARAAQQMGYAYIAVTDHSDTLPVVNGLNTEALARQIEAIDRLNETLSGLVVLKAVEVDIRRDGSLALPDGILKRLDLTVCSIHTAFDLSRQAQTERILRAMDNPSFNILAHPTGRRLGKRAAYDLDLERVMQAALARGCFLEINANPERLDLNGIHAKMAREMGLKLAISTDAHRPSDLAFMRYGVAQARRGWLSPADVLNARPLDELRALLKR